MSIPEMPFEPLPRFINAQYVDKDGNLTSAMNLYNDQLNRVVLTLISRYGWQLPTLTTEQLEYASEFTPNGLVNTNGIPETGMPVGTIWYDTTENKLKVKTALGSGPGTIKTVTFDP